MRLIDLLLDLLNPTTPLPLMTDDLARSLAAADQALHDAALAMERARRVRVPEPKENGRSARSFPVADFLERRDDDG